MSENDKHPTVSIIYEDKHNILSKDYANWINLLEIVAGCSDIVDNVMSQYRPGVDYSYSTSTYLADPKERKNHEILADLTFKPINSMTIEVKIKIIHLIEFVCIDGKFNGEYDIIL